MNGRSTTVLEVRYSYGYLHDAFYKLEASFDDSPPNGKLRISDWVLKLSRSSLILQVKRYKLLNDEPPIL
jgi:hypothetical protein